VARATEVFRSRNRVARGARLALAASFAVSAVALVIFHLVLFWDQIADGRLLDPAVAVRWGVSALLLAALAALRRAGVPLLWGRRALVVWVLVALLHWAAMPGGEVDGMTHGGAQATQVLFELPIGGAAALLLGTSAILLFFLAPRALPRLDRATCVRWCAAGGLHAAILGLHLASRAPPA
jgi:multisubunit Na+/H+ antiporter MnhB subunit